MDNNDYGYFGTGSSGYAHYTQAHDASHHSSDSSGGCGCEGVALQLTLLYLFFLVIGVLGIYYSIKNYNFGCTTYAQLVSDLSWLIPMTVGLIALPIYKIYRFFN